MDSHPHDELHLINIGRDDLVHPEHRARCILPHFLQHTDVQQPRSIWSGSFEACGASQAVHSNVYPSTFGAQVPQCVLSMLIKIAATHCLVVVNGHLPLDHAYKTLRIATRVATDRPLSEHSSGRLVS